MKRDEESQQQYYSYPEQAAEGVPLQKPQAQASAPPPPYYGTFQGQPQYPQPAHPGYPAQSSQLGHQTVEGYPVIEARPRDEYSHRLPCCGLGVGWCLFIIGFFSAIPWYVGAILLVCTRPDPRERLGLVCCTVAAILTLIGAIVGGSTAMR